MNIDCTDLFASLSNETRLRCLFQVVRQHEVCVCEVVDALGIPQPSASKALKALKDAGLVEDRRDANWILYRLSESMPAWVETIVNATIEELVRSGAFLADEQRFERSTVRELQAC